MAAGSLTVAALRHRPRQALLIVVLAAVVSASAVLGPLYARAVEQSVLRTVLTNASPTERGIVVTATGAKPPSPADLARTVRAGGTAPFGAPVGGADTTVTVSGGAAGTAAAGTVLGSSRLTSRDGVCRHLTLSSGRCFAARGSSDRPEVLVSQRNATALGVSAGDTLRVADSSRSGGPMTVAVAGVYQPFDAGDDYWFGRTAAGVVAPGGRSDTASLPALDALFTSWTTLDSSRWSQVRTHVDVPLLVHRVDLTAVARARGTARAIDARARTIGATSTTGLGSLVASTDAQRSQARTVVPLLAVQLALLGVVVLGFVCAAATEARRPEVALARLRGLRAAGSVGLLMRELGLLVVIGSTLGALWGWAVGAVATRQWLAPGTSLELRWPVAAAALGAAAAGLVAVALTALPTLRLPLVSLLRRVPPRASAVQVGLVEGGLVAVTAAGVVTLLSGGEDSSRGPVALLAPGLLAVAGGLLLAQVVVPVAGPLARRSLRRGRLVSALAGAQVARRPALRRLIAIITVACALLVFAVDTWAVADRNRVARAGVEAGAPVVLTVDARDARLLRESVLDVDPSGRFATPVVTATSGTAAGPKTTAVEPAAFARIALWGNTANRPSPAALDRLRTETVPSLTLTGDRVQLTAKASVTGVSNAEDEPAPSVRPVHLVLGLTTVDDNQPVSVDLGTVRTGAARYSADVPCSSGCLLRQVEIRRTFGDFSTADINVAVHRLTIGSGSGAATPVNLGPAGAATWQSVLDPSGFESAAVDADHPLTFVGTSYGTALVVQRGDVPVLPPALAAGSVAAPRTGLPNPQRLAAAPDLTGFESRYVIADRLPVVPRSGRRGVLVDLAQLAGAAAAPTTQTTYSVWLAADDPAREKALVARLGDRGVVVVDRDSAQEHESALASQGPTLALRLAVMAGVVALVLAAAVLVVGIATSGASRARDLAGLRIVGVPARVVRAAAVREHLTVAVLGVVAGVVLGLVAAQVALPRVPFFAERGPGLPIVRDPAWAAVAGAAAASLALLVVISVLVGRSLARLASPTRLREGR